MSYQHHQPHPAYLEQHQDSFQSTGSGLGSEGYPPQSQSTEHFNHNDYNPGLRERNTYPPAQGGKEEDDYNYAAGGAVVTRGSIAAQMAAEGQIPKKEGLRMWRSDEHRGAMLKGGRGRCCGRVCCCSIILAIVLFVGIVASFFLWVKPPSVAFNGIEGPATGNEVTTITDGFALNVRLKIGVVNPNFFGATFPSIKATTYYSTAPTVALGGGSLTDAKIPKNSNSTVHFPLQINYTTALDSNFAIISDIAEKCGFLTAAASDLTVNYKINLKVKVIVVTIPISFSSSTSFACPVSESEIESALGTSSLSDLLGSVLRKREGLEPADELAALLRARAPTWDQELAHAQVIKKVMARAWDTRAVVGLGTGAEGGRW